MSVRDEIDLPASPNAVAVQVVTGSADVFAIDVELGQVPLGTVGAGGVVPAASEGGCVLRVVSRLESTCASIDPVDLGEHGDGIALFTAAVVGRMGAFATPLQGIAPQAVPDVLAQAVPAYVQHLSTDRLARRSRQRQLDQQDREDEFNRLAANIAGQQARDFSLHDDVLITALQRIGDAQGFTVTAPPGVSLDLKPSDRLPGLAHASGLRYRPVRLSPEWDKPRSSSFLAFLDDEAGTPVALVTHRRGYRAFQGTSLRPERVTPELVQRVGGTAFEFTTPLSRTRAATWRDLVRVAMTGTGRSWAIILTMAALGAVLGLVTPIVTKFIIGVAVPEKSVPLIVQAGITLVIVAFAAGGFSMVMYFTISRVTQEATARVQPALWDRLLSMPASFFREFSSGDLSVRVMAADALQQVVSAQVVGAVLAATFSLVNIILMFSYSVTLGLIGLAFIGITIFVLWRALLRLQSLYWTSVEAQLQGTSWVVQLLTGISKIRLAGGETRMELPYLERVRRQMVALADMTKVSGWVNAWFLLVVPAATGLFFMVIVLQLISSGSTMSASTYIAFSSSFAIVFGAVNGLIAVLSPAASAGPIMRLMEPIMTSLPESASHRADPGPLIGTIEFRNVVFRYTPDAPIVHDRLNLVIHPGEMVALVGPSGSGKSTAVRLILGFESPEEGQVLIDGRDLNELDLDLVRSQMGVVIQNGQLTRGSIMKNILGAAGGDEGAAWKAAAEANLDEDIKAMPMRMQTMVDPSLVSGGQAQRILLARALARNPRVILLDEATSALDNESQARVSDALDALGATRIIVAHRLSTIVAADRIIVIEGGKAVQQGTYAELLAQPGEFAELARRQLS